MKIAVYNQKGEKVSELAMPKIFDVKPSSKLLAQYFDYLRSAQRYPVANTKNRGEVSGGGRKPYRQKGTGNARAGSTRSPLWVGGGVTFGPNNDQNFHKRINAKVKKTAICQIFAGIAENGKMLVARDWMKEEPKTKIASSILENVKAEGKIALITDKEEANIKMSFRNIAGVSVMEPNKLDPIYLFTSDRVIISENAWKILIEKNYEAKTASGKTEAEKPTEKKVEKSENE